MGFIIYKHTLTLKCEHYGWSYIGQTCQRTYKRWQNGKGYLDGHQSVFEKAIRKYGWENFSHEILEDNIQTIEEANEREKYWIAYYHTYVHDPECAGYNLTQGGNNFAAKQVICLETGQLFNTIEEAALTMGVATDQIGRQLNNHINTTTHRTIRKWHWVRYHNEPNIQEYINQCKEKYYILLCTDTNEKFMSVKEAALKYNISMNSIIKCLTSDKQHTAGGLHWKYIK